MILFVIVKFVRSGGKFGLYVSGNENASKYFEQDSFNAYVADCVMHKIM